MHARFSLVLVVTQTCNLRCSHNQPAEKFNRSMPPEIGQMAVDRALASLQSEGALEMAFCGGEPLLAPDQILDWMSYARTRAAESCLRVVFNLITNGTITSPSAWELCLQPDLNLTVNCEGTALTQNRHRRFADGSGSAEVVHQTLRRLAAAGKQFQVATLVRPKSAALLPENLAFLESLGVRRMVLSLDLEAEWRPHEAANLTLAIQRCAHLWKGWRPEVQINWFNDTIADLTGPTLHWPVIDSGGGGGQVAVAPSGRFYPCACLIGSEHLPHPSALPGHVADGPDFLDLRTAPEQWAVALAQDRTRTILEPPCLCHPCIRVRDAAQAGRLWSLVRTTCTHERERILAQSQPRLNPVSPARSTPKAIERLLGADVDPGVVDHRRGVDAFLEIVR